MLGLNESSSSARGTLQLLKGVNLPGKRSGVKQHSRKFTSAVYRQGSVAPSEDYRRPRQPDRRPQRQIREQPQDPRRPSGRQPQYDDRQLQYDEQQFDYRDADLATSRTLPRQQQVSPSYPKSANREPNDPRSRTYGQRRSVAPAPRRRIRPRFSPPAEDEVILSCSQVVNKQVITRVTGNSLGNISNFFADPDTLRIVSASLRPKGIALGNTGNGNLLLETFCQIGDVVLVHDESVLDLVPQDETVGFLDLIGCPVYTSQGEKLGKVRSFTFSPDSGKLDCIRYDALGWPAIPEGLVGVWEVGVECIEEIDNLARITLLPGTESELNRVSDGPLELAFLALQKLFTTTDEDALAYESNRELDREFEKWKLQYAPYFLKHYGQPPPATRQELDQFYLDLNSSSTYRAANQYPSSGMEPVQSRQPVSRQMASLPPGRQERMADVLQRAPNQEPVLRRPQEREDPRMRAQRVREPEYPLQPQQYARQGLYNDADFDRESRVYGSERESEYQPSGNLQPQRREDSYEGYEGAAQRQQRSVSSQGPPVEYGGAREQRGDIYNSASRPQSWQNQETQSQWGQAQSLPQNREGQSGFNEPASRQNYNESRSTSASVPLYDFTPQGPPHKRQDADGGFGEPQVSNESEARRKKSFDDWVQATEQMNQLSMAGASSAQQTSPAQNRKSLNPSLISGSSLPQAAQSFLPVQDSQFPDVPSQQAFARERQSGLVSQDVDLGTAESSANTRAAAPIPDTQARVFSRETSSSFPPSNSFDTESAANGDPSSDGKRGQNGIKGQSPVNVNGRSNGSGADQNPQQQVRAGGVNDPVSF